jgi:hypothetical protein
MPATLSSKLYNDVLPVSVGGTGVTSAAAAVTALKAQPTLTSGTNIKPINNTSLLGSGNISIKCIMPTPVISGNYTAASYDLVRCNSTSSFTITFPLTPNDGDVITVLDVGGLFSSNPVTISPNGKTIESDNSVILNISYACVTFVYELSTTNWVLGNKSSLIAISAPNPPTNVSASISLKTATISFTSPTFDGGSPITGYTATSSPGGLIGTTIHPSTSIIISNLLPGTSYTFTVTSANAFGTSLASIASLAKTTLSVPTTPSGISVVTASGQATVSFTSTSDPLVPITSYKVTSSGGQFNTGSGSPITVTGLTNGSSYTFTVIATNTMGDSAGGVSSLITIPTYDPYFSSVTVLINANTGANGSTTFYDSSSNGRTVTNNVGSSSVTVSTANVRYGSGSITTGTGYLTMTPTSTTTIGLSNNFTIEFWFLPNGVQGSWVGFCGNYMDAGYGSRSSWAIGYDGNGTGISCSCAFGTSAGSYVGTSTATVTNNVWHHLAFVRSGSVFTMYIDGISISSFTDSRAIYDGGSNLEIGSYIQGGYRFNGWMDDFRITKGVARYTAAFNTSLPPACPTQ